MSELANTLLAYFEEQGWPVQQHESEPLIRLAYGNEAGNWTCLLWHRDDLAQVVIYSVYPEKTPLERLADLAGFTARVNYEQGGGGVLINMGGGGNRSQTPGDRERVR